MGWKKPTQFPEYCAKLVFLRKFDAKPEKGIGSYTAIALTSVMSKWHATCVMGRESGQRCLDDSHLDWPRHTVKSLDCVGLAWEDLHSRCRPARHLVVLSRTSKSLEHPISSPFAVRCLLHTRVTRTIHCGLLSHASKYRCDSGCSAMSSRNNRKDQPRLRADNRALQPTSTPSVLLAVVQPNQHCLFVQLSLVN